MAGPPFPLAAQPTARPTRPIQKCATTRGVRARLTPAPYRWATPGTKTKGWHLVPAPALLAPCDALTALICHPAVSSSPCLRMRLQVALAVAAFGSLSGPSSPNPLSGLRQTGRQQPSDTGPCTGHQWLLPPCRTLHRPQGSRLPTFMPPPLAFPPPEPPALKPRSAPPRRAKSGRHNHSRASPAR